MKADDGAEKYAPEDVRYASEREQRNTDDHVRGPVPLREKDLPGIAHQIGYVTGEYRCVVVQPFAGEDPPHMRPPRAFARRVRIAFVIGILMMDPMGRNPENRPAFERQGSAPGEHVFDPAIGLVS